MPLGKFFASLTCGNQGILCDLYYLCGGHHYRYLTEEDVEIRLDSRRVALFVDLPKQKGQHIDMEIYTMVGILTMNFAPSVVQSIDPAVVFQTFVSAASPLVQFH